MKIWILLFLIMAAIYDYRDFKIPNKLNGAGALITLVLAGVSGMKAADMMIGVLVVLISCGLLFYIGCLGGGDVKLLMVCAISIGRAMPQFLILSFICNGIYAVIFLWKRKNFHLRLFRLFQYVTQCKDNTCSTSAPLRPAPRASASRSTSLTTRSPCWTSCTMPSRSRWLRPARS